MVAGFYSVFVGGGKNCNVLTSFFAVFRVRLYFSFPKNAVLFF